MSIKKTSKPKVHACKDIGAVWDEHEATEFGEQIDAEFEVDIRQPVCYFPIAIMLLSVSDKLLKAVA